MVLLGSVANVADTYKIDPAHTSVAFSVRHLGLSNVKGQFKEFAGGIACQLLEPGVLAVGEEVEL